MDLMAIDKITRPLQSGRKWLLLLLLLSLSSSGTINYSFTLQPVTALPYVTHVHDR
jgi:hypothetical protein